MAPSATCNCGTQLCKNDFSPYVLHFTEVLTAALSYMMLLVRKVTKSLTTGATLSLSQHSSMVYHL